MNRQHLTIFQNLMIHAVVSITICGEWGADRVAKGLTEGEIENFQAI